MQPPTDAAGRSSRATTLPDPDSRDQLLAPPQHGEAGSIDASAPGDRFAVTASSRYFITETERWCAELHDPYVLVTDRELSEPTPLVAVLGRRPRRLARSWSPRQRFAATPSCS